MSLAFVLVSAHPGAETRVLEALRGIPELSDVQPLYGEYDFICKVRGDDLSSVGGIVIDRIRRLPGVTETRTLPVSRV